MEKKIKTPQQIKNEVEKEIKRFEDIENGLLEVESVRELELNSNRLFNAKKRLQILTEYDKAMKEMIKKRVLEIEEVIKENLLSVKKQPQNKQKEYLKNVIRDNEFYLLRKVELEDFLSKNGDNSEVKK
jgi:hypothetical protein